MAHKLLSEYGDTDKSKKNVVIHPLLRHRRPETQTEMRPLCRRTRYNQSKSDGIGHRSGFDVGI